ncbi:MAG: HVO_0476 family zinc finger protein [Candidatus Thermoplasmatota archaeon]|nr:HVO_0476 family zinc finger protein [Candidatus Thermoplasmatota archaeon]MDP7265723.1 HVO_0476 family zinc finger protein [Candidatus Thermoplasmatota archaeon]
MKELPDAVYTVCTKCGANTAHEVLKGRVGKKGGGKLECTLRCTNCDFVHFENMEIPKERDVPLIVSDEENSYRSTISLPENDFLYMDDELLLDEYPVKVTSIELVGKRVMKGLVSDIVTIWAIRYDKVRMGLAINRRATTTSIYFWVPPDEEFSVGDIVNEKGNNVAITKIKTDYGTLKRGTAQASNITRLYGRLVK